MATKSEKKRIENLKKKKKEDVERMKNLSPNEKTELENYYVYQILYINDIACNYCKEISVELKKVPYRSNGAKKIYGALMKRVNAYFDLIANCGLDMNSIANFFAERDDAVFDKIYNFKNAIYDVFEKNNITHASWLAACETASTLCDYAVKLCQEYIKRIAKYSSEESARKIKCLVIMSISEVIDSLCKFSYNAAGTGSVNLNLNTDQTVVSSFKRLSKEFLNPDSYINAKDAANILNKKEGSKIL